MGRVMRINLKSPSDMAEENQTSKSDSSAPSGRLHPIVVLWRRWFGPKPTPPAPVWSGTCDCCGRDLKSFDRVFPDGAKVECVSCLCGFTDAAKKRIEDRRQIDLYKRAIRELEQEKHNT